MVEVGLPKAVLSLIKVAIIEAGNWKLVMPDAREKLFRKP